jgi:AraC-like DNA-binding protein
VRFTPYGAAALFKMPMDELASRITPVDDFAPGLARALQGSLESAKPVAAVESALSGHGAGDPAIAAAVQRITASRGAVRLARLADEMNLSSRQFERRFNAAVGLSPKTFCSLQRFTQVFRALGADGGRWVDTAVACGYCDQAHLIRDFKRFTGETPAALLAPEADLARHFLSRFGMSHLSNTAARGA